MKLRIKGNSVRFRLSKSDVATLVNSGEIAEAVYFGTAEEAKLGYALRVSPSQNLLSVEYAKQAITVLIASKAVSHWAEEESEVGIYGSVNIGRGVLEILVEKDFACLDATEEENLDTFANPIACQPPTH